MRILRLSLVPLLALFLFASGSYAQMSEESMLEQARRHFQGGKYFFATTWLGRILRDYPSTPHRREVLLLMAKAHALSGREEKATPYLRDLLKEFPEAAATLEPELLRLAKAAKAPPPPEVLKPSAPPPPGVGKTAPPASAGAYPSQVPAMPAPAPAQPLAKPAPAATAQQSPPEPAEKTAVSVPAVPAPQAEQAPPPAKPSPATPPLADAHGTVFYTLAAGETVSQKKLDALLKKLEGAGFLPTVQVETKMSEVFRLVSECYGDRKAAEKRKAEITRRGVDPFVSRSGDSFCVIAGSLMSESAARTEQKRLAGKGVRTKVVPTQVSLKVSRVSAGRFADPREAEAALKILAARGIAATVVKSAD